MADVLGLYEELCSAMPSEDEGLAAEAGPEVGFIGGGLLSAALKAWVLDKVRKIGCEQSDVILAAVQKWIVDKVKNPTLAAVLNEVAKAVVEVVCPV
jgi:hypothetical protein